MRITGAALFWKRSAFLVPNFSEAASRPMSPPPPFVRVARHPAAIRTGTSTTWLHRWAVYSRLCSGPSWFGERWKYCANYTPMLSEHGCERPSHDQPIVFPDRELLD